MAYGKTIKLFWSMVIMMELSQLSYLIGMTKESKYQELMLKNHKEMILHCRVFIF